MTRASPIGLASVVATSIAAHRTVLTDQLAVLAEPTSSALACAIIGLLTDSAKVEKLESAARQYADENLGWSKFVGLIRSLHPQLERLQVGDEPTISHGRSDPPT